MTHVNDGEAEKCLKEPKKEEVESATEVAASIFDLRFDPSNKSNKNTQKKLYPQILACIATASFHLPVGIVVAYSAILIPQLEHSQEIPVTKEQTGWIASLPVMVVPIGALLTGLCMDKIGRLNTIRVACVPYIIGWILIALADNIWMLYIGRFLTGFTLAMGPSPAIVYITEVARPDLRGSLICTGPSMTSFGMLLIYIKGAMLYWRTVAWLGIAYCILPILFMFLWAPESPVWLLSKGKKEKALKSFKFLARADEDDGIAERQVASVLKEIVSKRANVDKEDPLITRFVQGFKKPTGYKPLFILVMLFFFQQYAGIYITIFYAVTFFEEVNSGLDPYVCTIMIGLIRMLVGLVTSVLLKRYGRRILCISSGVGMTVMLTISAYYTRLIAIGELSSSWIPVACMLMYMSLSVIGLMSIPWTMTAELFPLEIRGLAQGLVVSLAHVIMFSALKIYRTLPDLLGGSWGVQLLFACMSLGSVLFVYIFLPETHMKKLSDIQNYFNYNTIYLRAKRHSTNNNGSHVI